MSKTKRLVAATLVVLALAAVPSTSVVLGSGGVAYACGNSGGSSCG